jgi:Conserved region in glutamate synthase
MLQTRRDADFTATAPRYLLDCRSRSVSKRRQVFDQRVLLRVDCGLKSGWDIIIAALMGAEEYGFGSIG